MLPRNHPDRIQIAFDDHCLVANAGLILPATLALRLGLPQLLRKHLDLGGAPGRANTGDKMMTLVASALAGGDCIDDADVLRAGGTARVLGFTAKAPSTLGTFLRSFLLDAPSSTFAEGFRQIRANIEFASTNQSDKVYLIASPGPGEGKSTLVSNIAVAFAHAGKRVIIIDGDMRRSSLHKVFSVERQPGLSDFLAGSAPDVKDVIKPTEVEGISVIPSGPSPGNPAELVTSNRMTELLDGVRNEFDVVLVDSPPILPIADASILSSRTSGVVIVVDGNRTRSSALHATAEALGRTKANILGVVINKRKRPRVGYGSYDYYYYGYYSTYYGDGEEQTNKTRRLFRAAAHRASEVWSRVSGR